LFYRGVGFFPSPLTLQLDANENHLRISTTNQEPLTDLFVLTILPGKARWQKLDRVSAARERTVKLDAHPFGSLTTAQREIAAEMKAALVRNGLYDREAQAMVDTWKGQWFAEQGVRVFYLLPSKWTDTSLPLEIQPRPDKVVRVMVGRAELITPSMEWELTKQIARYSTGDPMQRQEAVRGAQAIALGRFLEPATRKVLGRLPAREFSDAAWNLAREVAADQNRGALRDFVRTF
jgi:hypothetical protein